MNGLHILITYLDTIVLTLMDPLNRICEYVSTNSVWKTLNGGILETELMRYHIAKTSPKKNLIIADSQLKDCTFPNFNIVSIPGASLPRVRFPSREERIRHCSCVFGSKRSVYKG